MIKNNPICNINRFEIQCEGILLGR